MKLRRRSVSITGLNKLQKKQNDAQRAMADLNEAVARIRYNASDPIRVAANICEMERAVDNKVAFYRNDSLVLPLILRYKYLSVKLLKIMPMQRNDDGGATRRNDWRRFDRCCIYISLKALRSSAWICCYRMQVAIIRQIGPACVDSARAQEGTLGSLNGGHSDDATSPATGYQGSQSSTFTSLNVGLGRPATHR